MPLETGNFISDLVETNPPGTDNVSQGDDHLRLIKHVLKTQVPNLDCAVTATCEELNNAGKSGMPKVTVYSTVASAQTHTFDPASSWYRVTVTGGGGGGGQLVGAPNVSGGTAGGTAIKTALITSPTATYTVAAAGAIYSDGGDSSFDDATETVIGGGGKAGVQLSGGSLDGGSASGGDINLIGGGYSGGTGGASYWGGGNGSLSAEAPYGAGGKAQTDVEAANPGIQGVIIVEES